MNWEHYAFYVYLIEHDIMDNTDADNISASSRDMHFEIDKEGRLRAKLYDKREDFNFPIVNLPFKGSSIPAAPAYGGYTSHLIRYSSGISLIKGCC